MPDRIASGSAGQASMSAAKPGSMGRVCLAGAPDFAPLKAGLVEFCAEFAAG
jgi:hypothetical protein